MGSIQHLIGNTPLVRIQLDDISDKVSVYGKLEGQNPGGSVKDRAAFYMISKALELGSLTRDNILIEATSGNTGIALAMIAQAFGIRIKLVMPSNATPERILTMKAYGAEVILTPSEKTIEYSRSFAQEQANKHGYIILDQFNNPHNKLAHYETTGPEIWKDTEGSVTHFVSSMGTTGTITGTSKYLKSKSSGIKIIGAQPKEGNRIPGIRKWSEEMLPKIFEPQWIDEVRHLDREAAIRAARELASKHSIFAGMSSGGAFHLAKQIAQEITQGVIVFIVCDRGDRYLSSELYSSL